MKKGILLFLILFSSCLCMACTSKRPNKFQIKSDLSDYISNYTIVYDIGEYNTPGINMYYENHNLEIQNISVEKSLSEGRQYQGWLKIEAGDSDIHLTSYYNVSYQRYDNNKWELEYCEQYNFGSVEYNSSFNINSLGSIFSDNMQINNIELTEEIIGQKATVKITGTNFEGYYFISRDSNENILDDEPYYGYVDFEVVVNFEYDANSGIWIGSGLKENAKSLSCIDEEVLKRSLENAFIIETDYRARSFLMMPLHDFGYSINGERISKNTRDISKSALINNIIDNNDIDSMQEIFSVVNFGKYYLEKSEIETTVSFGKNSSHSMPALTYIINNFIRVKNVLGTWSIDEEMVKDLAVGVGLPSELKKDAHAIVFNISGSGISNYNNDIKSGRIPITIRAQDTTYDSDGTNIIEKTYEATEIMSGALRLRIKDVEFPFYCWIKNDNFGYQTFHNTIDITFDEIEW